MIVTGQIKLPNSPMAIIAIAIMAVPAHDERDHAFARTFELPIIEVVSGGEDVQKEAWSGDGVAVNSDFIDGLAVKEAKAKVIGWLEEKGRYAVRLEDKRRKKAANLRPENCRADVLAL